MEDSVALQEKEHIYQLNKEADSQKNKASKRTEKSTRLKPSHADHLEKGQEDPSQQEGEAAPIGSFAVSNAGNDNIQYVDNEMEMGNINQETPR